MASLPSLLTSTLTMTTSSSQAPTRRRLASFASFFFVALASGASAAPQGLGTPPTPPGNPTTVDKVQLGKALFWDSQLSSNRAVACGSCHALEFGGIDQRTGAGQSASRHPGPDGILGTADDSFGSPGVPEMNANEDPVFDAMFGMRRRVTPRRAPTVINAAFAPELFWDGRAGSTFLDPITGATVLTTDAALESLVAEPFVNDTEMGHVGRTWHDVVARIEEVTPLAHSPSIPADLDTWMAGRSYDELYGQAFGTDEVTAARTCIAIASYMRTLVSNQTPFDDFVGGNTSAMSQLEQDGFQIFQIARCDACHVPPSLSTQEFRYTGVRPRHEDLARFDVTGVPSDRGATKVPDIRNVALRAPFFHTGGKANLNEVIDFYSSGGDFEVGTNEIVAAPIFGANRVALLAFLETSLTDPRVAQGLPPFDHPALPEGTDRFPSAYGAGTAGSGFVPPRMHAFEVSQLGATDYTLAIDGALGGARAALLLNTAQDVSGTVLAGASFHVVRGPGMQVIRTAPLQGSGTDGGWGSVNLTLPSSPSMAGTPIYAQWLVVDPHAGGMLAATEAVEITLF